MTIGIIIDFPNDPTYGGGAGYIRVLINGILSASSQYRFLIFSHYSKEELKKTYKIPDHVEIIVLPRKEKLLLWLIKSVSFSSRKTKIFTGLSAFLEEKQKAIYYSFFAKEKIDCILYLPYNKIYTLDIPFFYTLWDIGHRNINEFPEVGHQGKFSYREKLYNDVLPRAYRVIAETEAGKMDIEFYYRIKPEKIKVVPLFAGSVIHESSTAMDAAALLSSHNLQKDKFLFYPAQLWAHKNHVNLLLAFQKLHAAHPELRLVLCGSDQGNLAYVNAFINKLGLNEYVKMMGFVEPGTVKILYEQALALVFPSFLGPSNMPLLEAMALSCPVICSDFEGHYELAGPHALYIRPEDPDSIVEAVESLIRDKAGRQNRIRLAQEYYNRSRNHIEKAVKHLLEEFENLEKIRRCWD